MAQVESMTRRELLERTGRVALTAGVLPFAGPLAQLARTAPPGIYGQLARTLQGDVVVPGDPAYGQARVLFDTDPAATATAATRSRRESSSMCRG
ncbi:MAG: hypothetical protein E6G64_09405 [Actinobacteria bacterium]|nr:MAG: hypothetical protein E6G64_09405 [Actinomycetota bacterium]